MNARTWNESTKSQREKLLKNAGHSPNLKYRAFEYVPKNVISDIEYIQKRQENIQRLNQAAVV